MTQELYEKLSKPKNLRLQIIRINSQIESWRELLFPKGISYDGERVQNSPEDNTTRIISEVLFLEAQRDAMIQELAAAQAGIIALTVGLREEEAAVVRMHYIDCKSYSRIAEELDYSKQGVWKISCRAVKKMEKNL